MPASLFALRRPELYFGTVNFNDQLTDLAQWQKTALRVNGMLLHVHFFVRHMNTPEKQNIVDAVETIRKISPALAEKQNIIELTFHIRDSHTSPEEIARTHAKNIDDLEKMGIPIVGVNVDWQLGILDVVMEETSRHSDETDAVYSDRVLEAVMAKSARYVNTFRAMGRDEALYAVFPPVYVDEGRWINARKVTRPNLTISRIINGLFNIGFAGFTADSPYFVLAKPAYKTAGYFEALRSIQQTCHQRGKKFGFIINGDNKETGDDYDREFAKLSLASLEMVTAAGLHPDRIISESWYRGPFRLVPETRPGTYTNTVLEIAQWLDGAASSERSEL